MKEAVLKIILDIKAQYKRRYDGEISDDACGQYVADYIKEIEKAVSALPEQGYTREQVLAEVQQLRVSIFAMNDDSPERMRNAFINKVDELKSLLSSLTPVAVEEERTERAYIYSRDYEALYYFLLRGNEPVALVDYSFHASERACRDVCRIRRRDDEIVFGVRGLEYGNVGKYESKNGLPQVTNFVAECERMNLEWITPSDSLAHHVN